MNKQNKVILAEIKPIKYISFQTAAIYIPRSFLERIGCNHGQNIKVVLYEDNNIRLEPVKPCPKCNGNGFIETNK